MQPDMSHGRNSLQGDCIGAMKDSTFEQTIGCTKGVLIGAHIEACFACAWGGDILKD